jgi:hypothetical protein
MATKIYLETKLTVIGARDKLLDFYDGLSTAKEYWGVDRDDFKELFTRTKGELTKQVKKRPPTYQEVYLPISEPPASKRAAHRLQQPRHRNGDEDDDEDDERVLARFWFDSDC